MSSNLNCFFSKNIQIQKKLRTKNLRKIHQNFKIQIPYINFLISLNYYLPILFITMANSSTLDILRGLAVHRILLNLLDLVALLLLEKTEEFLVLLLVEFLYEFAFDAVVDLLREVEFTAVEFEVGLNPTSLHGSPEPHYTLELLCEMLVLENARNCDRGFANQGVLVLNNHTQLLKRLRLIQPRFQLFVRLIIVLLVSLFL